MRALRAAAILALALAAGRAGASGLAARAAASCALETAGSTAELAVGGVGRLVLVLRPAAGVHVQRQAPLRATLRATPGLALSRERLGRADLVEPAAEAPRLEVPFTATAAGPQEVRARLEFFLCGESWCARQEREATLRVAVR